MILYIMSQKKDSIFIKLLKENTNIDEDFIDTFFTFQTPILYNKTNNFIIFKFNF